MYKRQVFGGSVNDINAWRASADEDVPITSADLANLLEWKHAAELLDKPKELLDTYLRLRATFLPAGARFRRVRVSGGGIGIDATMLPTLIPPLGQRKLSIGNPPVQVAPGPKPKPLTSVPPTQATKGARDPSPATKLLSLITQKESQILNSQPPSEPNTCLLYTSPSPRD